MLFDLVTAIKMVIYLYIMLLNQYKNKQIIDSKEFYIIFNMQDTGTFLVYNTILWGSGWVIGRLCCWIHE